MNGPVPEVTPVNQQFWNGTAIGELRLQLCKTCNHRFRFVTQWCPACWSTDLDYFVASGLGRITARTVIHTPPYESMAERVPYVLALIELEEGPTMMSNIVDCDPEFAQIGAAVQVAFEPRGDLQLPQFKLV